MDNSLRKRNQLPNHKRTWRNLKGIDTVEETNQKRPHTVWFRLYDTASRERQNLGHSRRIGSQKFSERNNDQVGHGGWSGHWKHYRGPCNSGYSNPTDCTPRRGNPNRNYGLWVTMTCQCRFIHCPKRTPLVGMLLIGRLGLWTMDIWKCESETVLKNKSIKTRVNKCINF